MFVLLFEPLGSLEEGRAIHGPTNERSDFNDLQETSGGISIKMINKFSN
jgi:hypothetical protein